MGKMLKYLLLTSFFVVFIGFLSIVIGGDLSVLLYVSEQNHPSNNILDDIYEHIGTEDSFTPYYFRLQYDYLSAKQYTLCSYRKILPDGIDDTLFLVKSITITDSSSTTKLYFGTPKGFKVIFPESTISDNQPYLKNIVDTLEFIDDLQNVTEAIICDNLIYVKYTNQDCYELFPL